MKIGLLSYRSHPYSGGQGIYVKHLSKALSDIGHDVSVLSGPPYPELDNSVELIEIPSLGLFEREDRMQAFSLDLLLQPLNLYEWLTVMSGGFPEPYTYGKRVLKYLKENNIVVPGVFNVSSANFCTTISNNYGTSVSTIEHLMGALFILGVDNAVIEIDNQEVPILDGSAKIFVEKILETGFEISNQPIRIIKINNKVEYSDDSKFISLAPNNINFEIDFKLEYANPVIGNQQNRINVRIKAE